MPDYDTLSQALNSLKTESVFLLNLVTPFHYNIHV